MSTPPEVSGATATVLQALDDADLFGEGPGGLTESERDLIRGVRYRLRHRLGEQRPPDRIDLHHLGTSMIEHASRDILREARP